MADHDSPELVLGLGPGAPTDAAGAVVRSGALSAGVSAERATRLRAVIEELVGEARARDAAAGDEEVTVTMRTVGDRLTVRVHDLRLPLPPGGARSLPSRRLASLGFVDRLHIAAHGPEGNVAECRVATRGTDTDSDSGVLEGSEVLDPAVDRVDDAAAAALVVRPMEPADAAGIARCVYRCYGYTYLDPLLYRPARLRHAVRSGALHPVVAVDPSGEVVGHCALSFENPADTVPEGGKLVVDPRYRGHHLAERLGEVRAGIAAELGVPGIWFECVTNHPYSQKEVLSGGGVETGLLIGATPAAIHMEGLPNDEGGRHALLTMWSPVAGTPPAVVHVSDAHAGLLDSMARAAGVERTVRTVAHEGSGPTSLSSSVTSATSVAHLRVHHVGSDLVEVVSAELDGPDGPEVAVVHLDLPLGEPATAAAMESLEALGFVWGAWLPGFDEGADVVRLQRIEERHVEVDHIECATDRGERLRDRVLQQWRRVRR